MKLFLSALIAFYICLVCHHVQGENVWVLDSSTHSTMLVGVGAGDATNISAVVAGSQNGVGSFVGLYDGVNWISKILNTGLILDAAITSKGSIAATSLFSVFISTDNGQSYVKSSVIKGTSQSANVFGANLDQLALVGSFEVKDATSPIPTLVYGVATSFDSGNSFSVSSSIPDGYARYGAFPSETTWYVSCGMWGSDPSTTVTGKERSALTARMEYGVHDGQLSYDFSNTPHKKNGNQDSNDTTTGWFGSVSKTVDGGKTWKRVLSTNLETDYIYFNGITCSSEMNCIVVGEGDDAAGGYLVVAYTTFDGGASWVQSLSANDVGLMSAKFVGPEEVWLLGTKKSGRLLYGQFRRSFDGGKSFTVDTVREISNPCICCRSSNSDDDCSLPLLSTID